MKNKIFLIFLFSFITSSFCKIKIALISDIPETQLINYNDGMGAYFYIYNYFLSPEKLLRNISEYEIEKFGWDKINEFSKKIFNYNIIILDDAPSMIIDNRNNGFWYSNLDVISDELSKKIIMFVKKGGGLLIRGGLTCYGDGIKTKKGFIGLGSADYRLGNFRFYIGYRNSLLSSILPIEIPEGETLFPLKSKIVVVDKTGLLKGISFNNCPYKGYHKLKAKSSAETLLSTEDGDPLIIWWKIGKGKVLCISLSPKANYFFGRGISPLWEEEPILIYRIINWMCNKKFNEKIENSLRENYKNLISIKEKIPFWVIKERYPYISHIVINSIPPDIEELYFKYWYEKGFTGVVFQTLDKKTSEKINFLLEKTNLYGFDHPEFGASTYLKDPSEYAQVVMPSGEYALSYGRPNPCPRSPETLKNAKEKAKETISILKDKKRIIGLFYDDEWAWWMGYRHQYEGKPGISCYCKFCNDYFKKITGKNPPFPEYKKQGYIAKENDLWIKWCEVIRQKSFVDYNKEISNLIKEEKPDWILSNYPGGYYGELDLIMEEIYLDCWRISPLLTFERLDIRNASYEEEKPIWALIGIFWMPEDKSMLPESLRLTVGLCLGRGAKGIILWNSENIWKPYFQHPGHIPLDIEVEKIGKFLEKYGDLFKKLEREKMPVWILGSWGWINSFDNYYHIPPSDFKDFEWNWFPMQIAEIAIPSIFRAGIPAEVITEKQLMSEELSSKKGIILPGLNYCREEVIKNLERYIKKGGKVFIDSSAKVNIEGAKRLSVDFSKWHYDIMAGKRPISHPTVDNYWKAWNLRKKYEDEATEILKNELKELRDENIFVDSTNCIYSILKNGNCKYLFVYNYDILNPHKFGISLNSEKYVNCLGEKGQFKKKKFFVNFQPGEWKLFILSDEKIDSIRVEKEEEFIKVKLLNKRKEIFKGAVPLKIILEKGGKRLEIYKATDKGIFYLEKEKFADFENITVEDMITGKRIEERI